MTQRQNLSKLTNVVSTRLERLQLSPATNGLDEPEGEDSFNKPRLQSARKRRVRPGFCVLTYTLHRERRLSDTSFPALVVAAAGGVYTVPGDRGDPGRRSQFGENLAMYAGGYDHGQVQSLGLLVVVDSTLDSL